MAPTKRHNNGRSPLVNPQRQITSFFTKATSPAPSPSPSPSSTITKNPVKPKSNPSPNCKPNPSSERSPSPSPSPTTPSPFETKAKKPRLVIGQTPATLSTDAANKSYGEEVVGRRVRVYWPLDKAWYEGCVKSFKKEDNKHSVLYDDGEEESLDLGKEKVEWVQQSSASGFKRLRRGSSLAFKKVVMEDDDAMDDEKNDNESDSGDEDWDKNAQKEHISEDEEVDLVDEQEEEITKGKKRKAGGGEKKSKNDGTTVKGVFKVSVMEPINNVQIEKGNGIDKALADDASERFGAREAEKFRFLGHERKDANKRRPGDPNYDPRTLYLPPDFLRSLTGCQRQWWEFKSKHMDKVMFFKMGKFYELFEMDAHIGVKELDLQYMKGAQPHCGFPEKNFSMNLEKLARKGYRVLVVEQTETPEQLELRRKEKGSKDKVVRREICAVVSKGTLVEGELLSANPNASYVMAVTESQNGEHHFGVCVVDVATSRIILGQVQDDQDCSALSCLLSELRPVEIIKPANVLSPETERAIMRHTRNPLVNELVPLTEFWDAEKTIEEIKKIYNNQSDETDPCSTAENGPCDFPEVLSQFISADEDENLALSALGGTLYYLKQAFLDETLLRFAKFEVLPCTGSGDIAQKPYLVLDAAALENLEIFENNRNGDASGTLYAQLNHCVTAFGKRLLKTWLARPLYHSTLIKERQEAVTGLRGVNLPFVLEFRKALSRIPDMERLLARIFASSEACGRNASKVVLYEDAAKKQLQEFIDALRGCESMAQACASLNVILENTESRKLHHILTPGKGLPDTQTILKHFKNAFDWIEASNSGRVIPHEGGDIEYDSASERVKEIESKLAKHLKEQRKVLGNASITYVTVGKEAYLLEVPESLCRNVPRDYELQSSKKGFYRYWTPTIKKLLGELSQAESEKESALKSILLRLIGQFCEHHDKWRQLVSVTAEVDVLISLAIASDFYEGPTCSPTVLDKSCSNEVPTFSAKSLGHPILTSDSLGKGAFVPNDITIGGSGNARFLLLTGPNMGGKSTLLRQACLAVILAQVGADVPAESFVLSPVDRIFVRMGAKDHIMAGQSTFLTELSETALMLSTATRNSLVILDELGRGTSTSDGQAIAESVLEHFVEKVQCRGMFSTHYHRVAIDYNKDPRVSLCHMGCQVGKGVGDVEEVTFLYRLSAGICPKSYGVNVARLAGLPDNVLREAAMKSAAFEAVYGRKESDDSANKMMVLIRNLISLTTNIRCQKSTEDNALGSLTELQHRARKLLL